METWGVLTAGLLIVVVGILRFKLHAFVALILAGSCVALLTPSELVQRSVQREAIVRAAVVDAGNQTVTTDSELKKFSKQPYLVVGEVAPSRGLTTYGRLTILESKSDTIFVYGYELDDSSPEEIPNELYVVPEPAFKAAAELAAESCISRLTAALGSYCGKLAILIVAASIIGRCLLESGAADRIVQSTISRVGEKNAPAAFVVSGFTLSIPVFFDTVFYLMVPLAKALRLRTGKNYLLYVLATVAGGTMAHSLVPPTPGPLFIAEAFDVPLSSMIFGGCFVGLISSSVGMLYAVWVNKRNVLELPEDATLAQEALQAKASEDAVSESETRRPPSVALALIPIVLPVILIAAGAFVSGDSGQKVFLGIGVSDGFANAIKVLAEKNTALMISAAVAVVMYLRAVRPTGQQFQKVIHDAVTSAGTIILVTAAGGAFGRMMRQANVAELLEGLPNSSPVMLVTAAFFVTTAVRTAQGSSTVAMLTSAGIFGGIVTSGAAGVAPIYMALAVGCGSKPFAWMNDSGFWVITRMSGMSESEGLRFVTPMTALAAFAGLATVIAGVIFFP